MLNGLLLIDKPEGARSTGCVARLRALLGKNVRVGHAGTLDSTASGLLILLVGAATRLSDYIMMLPKVYRVCMRLGEATDTCDYSGNVIFRGDISRLTEADVDRILPAFWGWRMQRPPEISALKLGGRPSHRLARAGREVELKPRPVFMRSVRRTSRLEGGRVEIEVHCGKGTYVRSLVRDLGERLGCGACVAALRRTAVGNFTIEDAALSPEVFELPLRDLPLRSPREAGRLFHRLELSADAEEGLLHGVTVPLAGAGRYVPGLVPLERAFCVEGRRMIGFVERLNAGGAACLKPRANILLCGQEDECGRIGEEGLA